jgi:hypothetical protein
MEFGDYTPFAGQRMCRACGIPAYRSLVTKPLPSTAAVLREVRHVFPGAALVSDSHRWPEE